MISAVTEETRRYLLHAYEPFNFDFVLKKTLVITTNLTNPESAPEMGLSGPEKKSLYFTKRNFLIFQEMELSSLIIFLYFRRELSEFENIKKSQSEKISYISENGTF